MFPGFVSPLPNPDSVFAYVRFAFRAQSVFPRPIQSFRVLLVTRTYCSPLSRGPADRPHFRCLASAQTDDRAKKLLAYYINMDPAYIQRHADRLDWPKPKERCCLLGTPYQTKLTFLANLLTFLRIPLQRKLGIRSTVSTVQTTQYSKKGMTCRLLLRHCAAPHGEERGHSRQHVDRASCTRCNRYSHDD